MYLACLLYHINCFFTSRVFLLNQKMRCRSNALKQNLQFFQFFHCFYDNFSVIYLRIRFSYLPNILFGIKRINRRGNIKRNTSFSQRFFSVNHKESRQIHSHFITHIVQFFFHIIIKSKTYRCHYNHFLSLLVYHILKAFATILIKFLSKRQENIEIFMQYSILAQKFL